MYDQESVDIESTLALTKQEIWDKFPIQKQTETNLDRLKRLDPIQTVELINNDFTQYPHLRKRASELEQQINFNFYGDVHLTINNYYGYSSPQGYAGPPGHFDYPTTYNLPSGYQEHPYNPVNVTVNPTINVEGATANSTSNSSQDNSGNSLPIIFAIVLVCCIVLALST